MTISHSLFYDSCKFLDDIIFKIMNHNMIVNVCDFWYMFELLFCGENFYLKT